MTLSERSTERIGFLYEVAKKHGSLISVKEMVPLLPEQTSERELTEAIRSLPSLGARFELKSGYVTEKGENQAAETVLSAEAENRNTAKRNILFAAQFVPFMGSTPFTMVSVSGSTSYFSASKSQDLDLFCIAPRGRMWSSLTQGLIFARMFRLLHPDSPQICLSCVLDEDYVKSAFMKKQNPLFARDALTTVVLKGDDVYQLLLEKAEWMSSFYPSVYAAKKGRGGRSRPARPNPRLFDIIVDRFLYVFVGTFISLKSIILNRKLARHERSQSVFKVRAGEDHLIYESTRYTQLRAAYSVLNPSLSSGAVANQENIHVFGKGTPSSRL
jgi:hypothetical protein